MDCPADWVRDIGRFVKSLCPEKLFVDGTYGVNATHLGIEEVDIFSNHYYGPSIDKLKDDLAKVVKANRTYFAGEYDWLPGPTDLADWFKAIETSKGAIGDAFWSQFGRNVPDCTVSCSERTILGMREGLTLKNKTYVDHNDSYTLQYGSPKNSAAKNAQM